MDKLAGIVILLTVLAVWLAVWLLPVYTLILASFFVKPRDWREVKWALRAASCASLGIGVAAMLANGPLLGEFAVPDFGHIARTVSWTWAGGVACAVAALVVGACFRRIRQRKSKPGSGEA